MKTIESNSLIAYASQLAVTHPELTPYGQIAGS